MRTPALAEQLADIATRCERPVRGENEWQWSACCPAHPDTSPSLRIGAGDDGRPVVNCLAGCDYLEVRAALLGRGVSKSLLRPAGKVKTASAAKPVREAKPAKPLPHESGLGNWHDRLMKDPGLKGKRGYLRDSRGLRPSTLMRFGIGHHYKRFTLPIRNEAGDLVNVRRYDEHAVGHNKMINSSGHGTSRLYPLEVLEDADASEPILLVEGEWDALLAVQHGLIAVTGTGGAGTPPKDLSPLVDRSVYVVYDCDKAGRDGARKAAEALLPVAKEVFVVDLGLPDGHDLTDWFVTHGRNDEALRTLLADARPFAGEVTSATESDAPLYVTLADLERRPLNWVWAGRIPAGKLTMLEGDPGLGKSMLWAKVVAHLTTGEPLPGDGEVRDPSHVLVICAEDDLNDTIVPRLAAAEADLTRVHSLALHRDDKGHLIPLSIPEDLPRLRQTIEQTNAALVVFDPITAYLSETINSGNDASVRRALTPLAEIAQTSGAAVLLIRHLNKQGDLKALYRGGGSIAFIGAARSGLIVDRHPEQEGVVVLAQTKSNLARGVPALTYSVESWDEDITVPVVAWGVEMDLTADELLKKPDGRVDAPARDEAVTFLRDLLSDGPVSAREIKAHASEAGIAWRTVERAKERALVRTRRRQDEHGRILGWEWFIPTVRIVKDEDES